MSALGARPKSVGIVNTAFGLTFATLALASMGITQIDPGSLSLASLAAGLFATFLVIVNPIDFILKIGFGWRLSHRPHPAIQQLLPILGHANISKGLRLTAIQVYSDSFFGFERSSMISAIYLVGIVLWFELMSFGLVESSIRNVPRVLDVVVLIGLFVLVVKIIQMLKHAPDKLGIIAAYSLVLRRPSLFRQEDVESFRRALVEGNWFEAEGWRTRIDLGTNLTRRPPARRQQTLPVQQSHKPNLRASLHLVNAGPNVVTLVADVSNTGLVGASRITTTIRYEPVVRVSKSQHIGALGRSSTKSIILDDKIPIQLLRSATTITLEIVSADESGRYQSAVSTRFSTASLLDDFNRLPNNQSDDESHDDHDSDQ